MFISPAYAQAAGGGGDLLSAFLPFVLIIGVFYFLMIRPQQKKQKEHKAKLEAIRRGDKVVLGGGIYGHVRKVDGGAVDVEIAPNVVVSVLQATILDVVNKSEAGSEKAAAAPARKASSKNSKAKAPAKTSRAKKTNSASEAAAAAETPTAETPESDANDGGEASTNPEAEAEKKA